MKESRKRVVFLRVLCTILTMFLHGKNQKQSRGKCFYHTLVQWIVNYGKIHYFRVLVVSKVNLSETM